MIITGWLKRFVKSSILDDAHTLTQLLKIKYEDPAKCVRPAKVDISYVAENQLKQLSQKRNLVMLECFDFAKSAWHL